VLLVLLLLLMLVKRESALLVFELRALNTVQGCAQRTQAPKHRDHCQTAQREGK
jgi:hypothetical protein